MVESTRLLASLLLVALATTASVALRPTRPDPKADGTPRARLPVTVTPSKYAIELTPNFADKTFTGKVTITGKALADKTKVFTFHAADTLTGFDGSVTVPDAPPTAKAEETLVFGVVEGTDMHTATWNTEVAKDADITITITYTGTLTEDMDGFYISTYKVGADTKYLASTQFESVSARKAFPCLDEPALKATFTMKITAPEGYSVLFNTKQSGTTGTDNVYNFEETPKMSTYLVAFVIYDTATFTSISNENAEKPQSVWSRDDLNDQRQLALDAGSQSLDAYSQLFGIDYFTGMMTKMDQIAIPDFSAGAMENWGLVTYRESELLGDPNKTSISDHRNIIETVAHELAHQWFGDYVTLDYWDVLWLNEGFATYWMYHVPIAAYDKFDMLSAFVAIDMEIALEADAYNSTHAMTYPLDPDTAFEGKFDDITYEKAGSVIRMMKYLVGDQKFIDGLKAYLAEKAHSNARPEDLYNKLGDATFVENMKSWSDTAGYPVVMVERNYEDMTATITQMRYYQMNDTEDDGEVPWITPITYINKLATKATNAGWLEGNGTLLIEKLDDAVPLIVNLERAGFFRVNYDNANWELIASQLQNDLSKVDLVTRAALVSDAFSMARSGRLDYGVALDLSTYLTNEVEYVPWEAALRHLSFLDTRLASTDAYNNFKKYMVSLLKKSYDSVTFEVGGDDEPTKRLHRENVLRWACKIGLPECSDNAKEALSTSGLDSNPDEADLNPDVRGVVLCEGVRTNDTLWELLQEQFVASTSATDKLVILKALGCSENTDILKQLLTMARDPTKVRPQDIATAYAAVYNNINGVDLVLDDISTNTAALVQQFGGLQRIFSGLGDKITTDAQITKMEALGAKDLGNAKDAYDAALSKAKAQVGWLKNNEEAITKWLNDYNSAVSASASILLLAVAAVFAFLNH